jgi:hypothetical protein
MRLRKNATAILFGALCAAAWSVSCADRPAANERRLTMAAYFDHMKGGWIGQMAGVGWAGPTEFKAQGKILLESDVPAWAPEMINQFRQDDLYVEMTFLRTLELHGFDVPIRRAGIDFANSGYPLWHANVTGRDLIRKGIAPPDSGHPKFNGHADDIDYQIEADFSGLVAPGLPQLAIELGEKFGRLMNYGDGVYAGQFMGALYAEAFFEKDPVRLVERALEAIPAGSQYAGMARDVLAWYREDGRDWEKTWEKVEARYHRDPAYSHGLCSGAGEGFSIDVKLNGAYVLMGLLFGGGDPDRTIVISMRCGQDSDCNPSSSAGVLFAMLGAGALPSRFTEKLDPAGKFSHTPYDFPTLVEVCRDLARKAVIRSGGRVERDDAGEEILIIPELRPVPSPLLNSWEPGPVENTLLTAEEKAEIIATNN